MIYSTSKQVLQLGSNHADVTELQQLLSQRSRPIPTTGHFDYETEIAVKYFQSSMFLNPDGVVGPLTWKALLTNTPVNRPTLQEGCSGSAVTAIQNLLAIDLYYGGAADGYFGPETSLAVKRLQLDYQITPNGVVDGRTWWALSEI